MLLGELFLIDELESGNGFVKAALRIRAAHPIFEGHFPGRPVLPGACLVQLVQELVSAAPGPQLRLRTAGPIKFVAMVEPTRDVPLQVNVTIGAADGGDRRIVADALHGGVLCFRFTGIFREASNYVG